MTGLTATDEVDDLVAIASLDTSASPLGTRQNVEISLDGDAAGRQREFAQQIIDCSPVGNAAGFAVNRDLDLVGHQKISLARSMLIEREPRDG